MKNSKTEARPPQVDYRWSPRWTVIAQEGSLRFSAGADLLLDAPPMAQEEMTLVGSWPSSAAIERPRSDDLLTLFEQLLSVGAIVPSTADPGVRFEVSWLGSVSAELLAELERSSVGGRLAKTEHADNHLLLIRTTASWSECLTVLNKLKLRPYLFVDLAYEHTISLGPFVIPGETSCAACLAGRIATRWGDQQPPPAPAVLENSLLIAGLLERELKRCAQGNPTCLNATIVWDLDSGSSGREPLYKVPECPCCATAVPGSVSLPWAR